uniref:Transposase n=1 Tax=Globodera rostochiensis TaxID=31243 RepID=A0A914HSC8_GLORO
MEWGCISNMTQLYRQKVDEFGFDLYKRCQFHVGPSNDEITIKELTRFCRSPINKHLQPNSEISLKTKKTYNMKSKLRLTTIRTKKYVNDGQKFEDRASAEDTEGTSSAAIDETEAEEISSDSSEEFGGETGCLSLATQKLKRRKVSHDKAVAVPNISGGLSKWRQCYSDKYAFVEKSEKGIGYFYCRACNAHNKFQKIGERAINVHVTSNKHAECVRSLNRVAPMTAYVKRTTASEEKKAIAAECAFAFHSESFNLPSKRFPSHLSVRWLTLGRLCSTIVKQWPVIEAYFRSIEDAPKKLANIFAEDNHQRSLEHKYLLQFASFSLEQFNAANSATQSYFDEPFFGAETMDTLESFKKFYSDSLGYLDKWLGFLAEYEDFGWIAFEEISFDKICSFQKVLHGCTGRAGQPA